MDPIAYDDSPTLLHSATDPFMGIYTVYRAGYYVHFAAPLQSRTDGQSSGNVTIVARRPTVQEQSRITMAVGWLPEGQEVEQASARAIVRAVVAEDMDTGDVVGFAFLFGDTAVFTILKM